MRLFDFKEYIKSRGQVCSIDLSGHFGLSLDAVNIILEEGIKNGKLRKRVVSQCCNSGCIECNTGVYDFFEWVKYDRAKKIG